ncbi:aminotransferase class I/II-fold pyridoxal phosphate-dependent enzyme [Streptomyces stelliscabiei]
MYAPFYAFIAHDDRVVVEAHWAEPPYRPGHARGHVPSTRERSGSGALAYLLSNPHNPTGTVHTSEELCAVAELARRYGVRVVADEIHAPLVLPGATSRPT